MHGDHAPPQNQLLAALSPAEHERLTPELALISLSLGEVLYESGDRLRHVYFPTDSIVSLLYVMEDGASAEIAVVGNEGLIGVALFMGGETTTSRAINRAPVPPTGWPASGSRMSFIATVRCRYFCCATRKR
jgi:hypothetical protein